MESARPVIVRSAENATTEVERRGAFITAARASRAETLTTGVVYPAAQVHAELRAMVAARRKQLFG